MTELIIAQEYAQYKSCITDQGEQRFAPTERLLGKGILMPNRADAIPPYTRLSTLTAAVAVKYDSAAPNLTMWDKEGIAMSSAEITETPAAATTAAPAATSRRLALAILPWTAYLLVTLLLLRALLPRLSSQLVGANDGWQNVWNLWWMRYSLLDLHINPYYTNYIYYPNQVSLLFHSFAPLTDLLALPFTVLLGPLVTANLVAISSFVFTAIGGYALGRGLGLGWFAAWIVGAVYSFCNPMRWNYFGSGQAVQLMMLWMPLYILCLVKATPPREQANRLPRRWLAGAAIFLACTALTDWQYLVYMMLFTAAYFLYLLLRERSWNSRLLMLRNVALAVAGGLLMLSPILIPSLREALANSYTRPFSETLGHSWDLTTWFTPNALNPLWGGWAAAQSFVGNRYGAISGMANSGYLPLMLALVGLFAYRRQVWQWAAISLLFAALALGPHLFINDVDTTVSSGINFPLPYNLLLNLPFFNISRDPARFSLIAYLCIGVLAGYGWQALSVRLRLPQRGWLLRAAVPLLVAAIMVAEFIPISYATTSQPISPFYYQLGADAASYAILQVPVVDKTYIEFDEGLQYIHHKQLLGGQIARKPCHCFALRTPVIRWFSDLAMPAANDILTPTVAPSSYAAAVLAYYNIRYIVLSKWMLGNAGYISARAIISASLPGLPVADDAAITAYAVPITATTTVLPMALGDGWSNVINSQAGVARRMGPTGAALDVINPRATPRLAQLSITLIAAQQPRTLQLTLNGQPLASPLIQPQTQIISLPLTLPPGNSELLFTNVPDPANPRQRVDFAISAISIK